MNKKMKRMKFKIALIAVLFVSLCALSIPSVYALFQDTTKVAENNFQGGIVNISVVEKNKEHEDYNSNEEFYTPLVNANDSTDKVVSIKNKGCDAYVRVTLEAVLVKDDDENSVLLDGVEVEYTFSNSSKWKVDDNQTFYYTDILKKDQESDILFKRVTIKQDIPKGYHLEVKVLSDAISASSPKNLQKAWNISDFSHMNNI